MTKKLHYPQFHDIDLCLLDKPGGVKKAYLPKIIQGNLIVEGCKRLSSNTFVFPEEVWGNVIFQDTEIILDHLVLPDKVRGNIEFPNLQKIKQTLTFPKTMEGSINMPNLKEIGDGLILPSYVNTLDISMMESIEKIKEWPQRVNELSATKDQAKFIPQHLQSFLMIS